MAPGSAEPRIFVSYARSDGEAFAKELRRRLQDEHGFPLWQDLADMEGGRDWWLQITDAIDRTEYLVLVMTLAALASATVRREWRYARQQGKCVIPVIGAKGLDFASLPGWMRRTHFVDPDEPDQWRRFVRTLEAPCKATRVPLMLEDLPPDYVVREEELAKLRAKLLDPAREEPVAITAALKGAGGYGKTTLARALGHDEQIQESFTDGILWVTLGEQPGDLISHVQDLIGVLTGEPSGFKTMEAATNRLAEVLGERRMLIVIDDVWNAVHVRPFLQGGPNCGRLVTTRNSDTLPVTAQRIDVDAMKGNEATDLLRHGLPDGEHAAFDRLAARLGEWPLLLKLVNGALRRRVGEMNQPVVDALAWVGKALDRRGLTAFDAREAEYRSQAVAKTLGVSLELLDEGERARFSELAIFSEDVEVPLDTVAALWGRTAALDDFETEELCGRLLRLSLLLQFDLATRRIRLHDVIRGYLQGEERARLAILHAELIEAYGAHCPDGWHTGPDDGYFFQQLPYHFAEAGRGEELRELLLDYRWLQAKLNAVGVSAAIDDLERFGGNEATSNLSATLRLSAHVLAEDARQLVSQLIGRLADEQIPELAQLVEAAGAALEPPALVPRRATLTPPGTGLIRTIKGHEAEVLAVAVLPDGKRALTGSDDRTARLWDLASGKELQRFEGHGGGVGAVAVLPDGQRALTGSDDRTARLWDLASGKELAAFTADGGIHCLAVTPDGSRVVAGDRLGRLHVLEIRL